MHKKIKTVAAILAVLGYLMFMFAFPLGTMVHIVISLIFHPNSATANFNSDTFIKNTYVLLQTKDVWLLFCGVFVYVGYIFIKAFPAIWKYIQTEDPASSVWEQKFTTFGNKLVAIGISIGFALSLCRIAVAIILK
jgi:hypothetical protein